MPWYISSMQEFVTLISARHSSYKIKISVHSGSLFRATWLNVVLPDVFSTDAVKAWLKSYLEAARLSNKTLYSFRRSGAITMALTAALWTTLWNIWVGNLIAWLGITCSSTNRSYLKALWHEWPRLHQTHPLATRKSISFEVLNLHSPRIYPVWLPHRYASHPEKCSMEHVI